MTYRVPCKNQPILFEFEEASFSSTETCRRLVRILKDRLGVTNLGLESIDKRATDELSLLLWVCDSLEARVKLLGGIYDPQLDTKVLLQDVLVSRP